MDSNKYDQEIDLKDLIFAVFRRWRIIIIIAFLFALLMGGYKSVKELTHQNDENYIAELKELYQANEIKYEQSKRGYEQDIASLTASIAYQEKYKENSILLKVDPYNKATASVDLFVKMEGSPNRDEIMVISTDPADSVVKAYASGIQQGNFLEDISTKKGIELIYLKELIKVTTDYDSNMLNVSVTYTDKEGAGEILGVILNNLKTMYPAIQEHLDQYSLALMNQDIGFINDQTLADYQKQKVVDLAATNVNLEDTEKALKSLEKPNKPVALSPLSILKECVKYGIFGGVVGAMLAVFSICFVFFMNGRLNTKDDLKNRFSLSLLGSFTEVREKKVFPWVDMWLDKLEERQIVSDESMYGIIAANILGMLNKGESVFLTGMVDDKRLACLADEIQRRVSEIKLGFGTDLLHRVQTLQKLRGYDTVILVEVREQSKIKDIEKEVETVHNMKKQVMGYIVMNPYKGEIDS